MKLLTPNHYPVNREGLVGWYSYRNTGDVATLGAVNDYSGRGNHGTLVGSAILDAQGFDFNSGHLQLPVSDDFFFGTGDFSFSLWMKPAKSNVQATMFSLDSYTVGILCRYFDGAGSLYVRNAEYRWLPTGYKTLNQWIAVSLTREGNTVCAYLDCDLVFTVINDRNLNDNRGLYFGNRFSAEEYFDGRMDDIQIYNRGLSASEIKLNYERNKKA